MSKHHIRFEFSPVREYSQAQRALMHYNKSLDQVASGIAGIEYIAKILGNNPDMAASAAVIDSMAKTLRAALEAVDKNQRSVNKSLTSRGKLTHKAEKIEREEKALAKKLAPKKTMNLADLEFYE